MTNPEQLLAQRSAAHDFMRKASSVEAGTRLVELVRDAERGSSPAVSVWFDAALQAGHFDIAEVRRPTSTLGLPPAYEGLIDQLRTTVLTGPHDPQERTRLSWIFAATPAPMAPGMTDFLAQLAVHPRGPFGAEREDTQWTLQCQRAVLACAIAQDQPVLVGRLYERFLGLEAKLPLAGYIPMPMLQERTAQPMALDIHPGAAALHFAARGVLAHLLDNGWQPAARAAWRREEGDRTWLSMPELLRANVLKLEGESLGLVCRSMLQVGLPDAHKDHLVELMKDLCTRVPHTGNWSHFVLSAGLAELDPYETFFAAAKQLEVAALEAVKDRVQWSGDRWERLVKKREHPALTASTAVPVMSQPVDPDACRHTVQWFLTEAQARGPEAIEQLFSAKDRSGATLGENLVRAGFGALLCQAIDMGLDPMRRVDERTRSAMDAAVDHGRPDMEALIRARLAGNVARDALRDLESASLEFRVGRLAGIEDEGHGR